MARVFAQDCSEIAIEATLSGRPHVNVLHFYNDEAAKSDEQMARDILNNWQDHMLDLNSNNYVLTGATWRSLDPDDLNQGTLAPDPAKPVAGVGTGTVLPPNVSFLIKKVTNGRQRGQRDGRIYLGGVAEAVAGNDGVLDSALRATRQTALDLFLDGVNDDAFGVGGGSGLVVLNTTPESRAPGTQAVDVGYRTVSALTLDAKVATQRDRLR